MGGTPGTGAGWIPRRRAVVRALVLASLLSVALVAVRVVATGSDDGLNLVWNLALAWVPLVVALLVHDASRRRVSPAWLLAGVAVWLVFLPNAPYVLTDYKLLRHWDGPVALDAIVISGAAWTGLALGLVSVYLVHVVLRSLLGVAASWAFVVGLMALSSFGIYLGHIGRWNSWDLVTRPVPLLRFVEERLADPLAYNRMLALIVVFTLFLTIAYALFFAVVHPRLAGQDE